MKGNPLLTAALCDILALALAVGALAGEPGEVQRRAAGQAAPPLAKAPEPAELGERVTALERQGIVLREDLGKARLDAVSRISDLESRSADAQARLQERIDALRADLEAERRKQAERNRHVWLALGIIAVVTLASD
jgi:hypothetical protein